jgi:hypothetical protein
MEPAKRRAVAATMMAQQMYHKLLHASVRRTAVTFIEVSD